jgi:3-oxoacyl-[acyl-carrier protein] reductase
MTEGRLAGRIAVVTGAARNIGLGIARRFAGEGARVAMLDVDTAVLEAGATVEGALPLVCDVSSAAEVAAAFDAVLATFGGVDVLVNNAAIVRPAVRHFLDADEAWWDLVVDVNLKGHFLCAHRAAQHMAAAGRGVIINLSSGGATRAHRGMSSYDAAKGGTEALVRAMALDLAPYGVRAVGIVPGLIVREDQSAEAMTLAAETVPLGRMGTPDDIAAAAAFLASDDASYISGSVVVVDGALLSQQRSPQVETFPVSGFPHLAT